MSWASRRVGGGAAAFIICINIIHIRERNRERERKISSRPGQGGPDTRYFYLHPRKKNRLVALYSAVIREVAKKERRVATLPPDATMPS